MNYSALAKEVFELQNKVRQDPSLMIPVLENRLKYFKDKILHLPGTQATNTKEGANSVQECIDFLKKQKPVGPLVYEKGLEEAARDHAEDLGTNGMTGHEGSDHSTTKQRIERHGSWKPGTIGENISFGKSTAEDIVIQLIVDDGVPSRGHRSNFFEPAYKQVGIFGAPHKAFKHVFVFDFASKFSQGGKQEQDGDQEKDKKKKQQEKKVEKQKQKDDDDDDDVEKDGGKEKLIPGAKKVQKKVKTITKGGKKHIITTKIYTMNDGTTKEEVTERVEDA
ncbi:unnamed protein product [Paramecium primaurelia]|uniref:SCP domain-containing protein n=1 Tax=Paramecium primaurelia TaxID=5886 RepID=A0A8S1LRE7_PARPR|nr:unnamed protein product [Paramecium primaurelia]